MFSVNLNIAIQIACGLITWVCVQTKLIQVQTSVKKMMISKCGFYIQQLNNQLNNINGFFLELIKVEMCKCRWSILITAWVWCADARAKSRPPKPVFASW